MLAAGSILPRMMAWSVAFEQLSRDLGVDAAAALEDAEDRRLAAGAASAPAAHPVRAEVALVDLHLACEGAFVGGQQRDASAEQGVETQHGLAVQTAELGRLGRGQIGAEASEHLPQLGLIHARVAQIAVFLKHRSTLDGARTTLSGPDPKTLASGRSARRFKHRPEARASGPWRERGRRADGASRPPLRPRRSASGDRAAVASRDRAGCRASSGPDTARDRWLRARQAHVRISAAANRKPTTVTVNRLGN